jgi:hypothetical protein
MASIEEERGTSTGRTHRRHNGYYAGDFSRRAHDSQHSMRTDAQGWPATRRVLSEAPLPFLW